MCIISTVSYIYTVLIYTFNTCRNKTYDNNQDLRDNNLYCVLLLLCTIVIVYYCYCVLLLLCTIVIASSLVMKMLTPQTMNIVNITYLQQPYLVLMIW